jgi:alkylation response protein AidB-like acyl-CoA dehydrogenase
VAAAVLGPEQLRAQASEAALCVAAVAAGIGRAALDHARDYADVREQFGRRLRMFEGIRFKLADMALRVGAARALLQRAATAADTSLAKVAAAEAAMYASTEAVQVFGGYGYMRDYPVEKLMRDAKAMSLLGGADERHRIGIAERLYAE